MSSVSSNPGDISSILRERRISAQKQRNELLGVDTKGKKDKDSFGISNSGGGTQSPLRNGSSNLLGNKKDKSEEIASYTSSSLTRSRNLLLETVNRSTSTLEHLSYTSSKITETNEDLLEQSSTISTSKSLLGKYGRREWTDRLLIFLAFLMFLGVVLYIVQKRFL